MYGSLIFACNPINEAWDIMITWGSCINQSDVYLATAITNAISDIFLILIPVKIAWNLHLRPIQKSGVFALFSMGGPCMLNLTHDLIYLAVKIFDTISNHHHKYHSVGNLS